MPFLAGTEPKPDGFHSKGCFDIVAMVASDDRRPQQWVESAQRWADRYVNGQTGGKGDPSKMSTLGPDKVWLSIAPVPGNRGFGTTICGQRRATPKPSASPGSSGSGGPKPSGPVPNPSCKPKPHQTCPPAPIAAAIGSVGDPSAGALVPIFGGPLAAGAASYLVAFARRRRRRRR
jgi:hypothetical protein